LERNIEIRGLVAVPEIFARTLRRRLSLRVCFVRTVMNGPWYIRAPRMSP
jgi:hypothetical protein